MIGKIFFTLQYWLTNPPWDTGVTPPEVYDFLKSNPPGRALDLGCGTGTNVLTLAKHGWQVTGVDYVPRAIKKASQRIYRAGLQEQIKVFVGDVLKQNTIIGEYDLILDIGCFHIFFGKQIKRYKDLIYTHLVPGGYFLLYAHLSEDSGSGHGAKGSDLDVLESALTLISRQDGEESSRPSAWLLFQKPK